MKDRFRVVDQVPCTPDASVYAEGWQSWSPTSWWPVAEAPRPGNDWQHAMRYRPDKTIPTQGVQGEGLVVVDDGQGSCIRYSTTSVTGPVPSIRAAVDRGQVIVASDGAVVRTVHASRDDALTSFPATLDVSPVVVEPPTVWCSWYRYFEEVTSDDVLTNLAVMEDLGLPVDVVQVDDGWATGWGDHLSPCAGFGSFPATVEAIRDAGRRAGVWLAPFLAAEGSILAVEHPELLTGYAGHNWGADLLGLDLSAEAVLHDLHQRVQALAALGIDYFKLDFLYAGALPVRGADAVDAYRTALAVIRAAAGPDAYLVGCGAPLLWSVGLVDAMRVSPDTFHEDVQDGSQGLRGATNLASRAWQHGRLWTNDPDCVVMRPSFVPRDEWAELTLAFGGLRSVSDELAALDEHGIAQVRRVLSNPGPTRPLVPGGSG